jgi:hypothetical protein
MVCVWILHDEKWASKWNLFNFYEKNFTHFHWSCSKYFWNSLTIRSHIKVSWNTRTNSFRFNSFSLTESISAITTWLATRYLPRTPWALLPAPYLDVCQRPINSNMSARGLCQQLPRVIRLGALHSVGHFSPSADWDVRECPHLAVTLLSEWKLKKLICFYFLVFFWFFNFLH